jgi:hypothetical protein
MGFVVSMLIWLFFLLCGDRFLSTPDEARYVEIPREMVYMGDYVTPRLNGVKYFEKPPLFYWMQVGIIKAFDTTKESFMRLWHAVLGFLGVLSFFLFMRKTCPNSKIARSSLWILSTCILYQVMSLFITLDMPLSTFMSLSLMCAYLAIIKNSYGWMMGAGLWAACAFLTKGVIGILLPGIIIFLWLSIDKRWKQISIQHCIIGCIVFLCIAAPWHILVCQKNPEFFHKYFIVEHWVRYTTSYHGRTQPWWFFTPILIFGFLPWIFEIFKKPKTPLETFLWVWAMVPFIFFSMSNSKLIPYVLPCMMPMAGLTALFFKEKKKPIMALIFMSTILCVGLLLSGHILDHIYIVEKIQKYRIFPSILKTLTISSGVLIGIWFLIKHKMIWYSSISLTFLAIICIYAKDLQKPSIKPIADIIKSEPGQPRRVVCFKGYFQDLPVYLNKIISVCESKGELEFGMDQELHTQEWMFDQLRFDTLMKTELLWIVCEKDVYQNHSTLHHLPILYQSDRYVLLKN